MSKVSPRCAALIAEHSMCQPGRPRPHGLSQPGSVRVRRLPQHEIGGVALVGRHLDAGAGDHLVAAAAGEAAVIRIGADREQNMPFGGVGVARGDQPLDHRDHLRDVRGRPRLDIGRQHAERRHVLVKGGDRAGGQRLDRLAVGAGGGVDLVLDVGDVADVAHMLAAVGFAQQPVEHVEHDKGAGVADMGAVIDRRPAHIHAHVARIERLEHLLAAGQRIIESERHDEPGSRLRPTGPSARRLQPIGLVLTLGSGLISG